MPFSRVAVFLSVVLGVIAAIHFYIWARLVYAAGWPPPWPVLGGYVLAFLAVSLFAGLILRRTLPLHLAAPVTWTTATWMGLMFLLFALLVPAELVRVVAAIALWIEGAPDPNQGLVVARAISGAVAASALGLAAAGMVSALGPIAVKRVRIPLGKLPRELDGFTIVQMSDIHVGPTIGRRFVERLVERVNALDADLVAITGDLVDGPVEGLGALVAPLGGLRARHGVYFVTGNHDYYSGADAWVAFLRGLGIRALRNERVAIERGGAAFDLAGVEDWSANHFGSGHGADLGRALAGRDASRPVVLLAHQPKAVEEAAEMGVDLQLSGHTHGGQIFPFNYLVRLAQPYVSGLHRHGPTALYVSNGTGYWGPPMRVGAPAEITRIELAAG